MKSEACEKKLLTFLAHNQSEKTDVSNTTYFLHYFL